MRNTLYYYYVGGYKFKVDIAGRLFINHKLYKVLDNSPSSSVEFYNMINREVIPEIIKEKTLFAGPHEGQYITIIYYILIRFKLLKKTLNFFKKMRQ